MLKRIIDCFQNGKVLYSKHALVEMDVEPLGLITSNEVYEAINNGNVIENYPTDEPYPSCLIFGKTESERPIHVVCASDKEDLLTIVVTVYQPSPDKWINFEKRRK